MKKIYAPFQALLLAFLLGLSAAPAFAEDLDLDLDTSTASQFAERGVNCESLREKAGRLCNSLHPGDDAAFTRCFNQELDSRCK